MTVVKSFKILGLPQPLMVSYGNMSEAFVGLIKDVAPPRLLGTSVAGACPGDLPNGAERERAQAFLDAYAKRYSEKPDMINLLGKAEVDVAEAVLRKVPNPADAAAAKKFLESTPIESIQNQRFSPDQPCRPRCLVGDHRRAQGRQLDQGAAHQDNPVNLLTQAVISGLMIGAVYAFLGIGLVLVYRTARILNLAHGESFAITGFVAAVLAKSGVPLGAALLLAILVAVAFALSLHRFVLRPRAEWPAGTLILITLGAAFVVRGVLILVAAPIRCRSRRSSAARRCASRAASSRRKASRSWCSASAARPAVAVFLARTRSGKQLLAAAENPYAAELLGVNVERARLTAYGIGALLGALAGGLLIPLDRSRFPVGPRA